MVQTVCLAKQRGFKRPELLIGERQIAILTLPALERCSLDETACYLLLLAETPLLGFAYCAQVLDTFLDGYWSQLYGANSSTPSLSVFDLAAGSGEVTQVVQGWHESRWSSAPEASVPSRAFIPAAAKRPATDLRHLPQPTLEIIASDPFTGEAYTRQTGLPCLPLSFTDLAQDRYPISDSASEDTIYDLTICSFALHLLTNSSELWALLQTLQHRTRYLVVIAPHKQPQIKDGWGFVRIDPRTFQDVSIDDKADVGGEKGDGTEIVLDRVRLRIWRSAMV